MFPLLWFAGCLLLQVMLGESASDPLDHWPAWIWVATMWAGWAASLWLLSAMENQLLRWGLSAIALVWHAQWMSICRELPSLRYFVMFLWFAIVLELTFRSFRAPHWKIVERQLVLRRRETRQFAIREMLLLTTMVALSITIAKQYQPPSGELFWIGLPLICVSMSALATLVAHVFELEEGRLRPLVVLTLVGTALLCARLVILVETILRPSIVIASSMTLTFPYVAILSIYFIELLILAALGCSKESIAGRSESESPCAQ